MSKRKIYFVSASLILAIALIATAFIPIFPSNASDINLELLPEGSVSVDYGFSMPQNDAKSAIVIDSGGRNVLFSKNADEKRGMASTTKIMTALVAIENSFPETEVLIPKEAVGIEGSSVYLKENEPLTIRELLYCLLLESGNDAATAIAVCIGGTLEGFVELMNERATELELKNTHFSNPHGLSHEEHYTTARELAVITAEAMQYPLFCEIVATKSIKVRYDGVENGRLLVNHNKLLKSYDGANGGKTGYTKKDGRCLVSSAERNGLSVIAVTLDDPSPTQTHTKLLDTAFDSFELKQIVSSGEFIFEIPVQDGEDAFLTVENKSRISICLPKEGKVNCELILPENLKAPIKSGYSVGNAVLRQGKDIVYIIKIHSTENIKEKRKSFFERYFKKQ